MAKFERYNLFDVNARRFLSDSLKSFTTIRTKAFWSTSDGCDAVMRTEAIAHGLVKVNTNEPVPPKPGE